MKTIYKYQVDVISGSVKMPQRARILHVAGQRGKICLWALVDMGRLDELRHLRIYGTGQNLPDDFAEENPRMGEEGERYIGTAMCGEFVWHVFERWQ